MANTAQVITTNQLPKASTPMPAMAWRRIRKNVVIRLVPGYSTEGPKNRFPVYLARSLIAGEFLASCENDVHYNYIGHLLVQSRGATYKLLST